MSDRDRNVGLDANQKERHFLMWTIDDFLNYLLNPDVDDEVNQLYSNERCDHAA